MTVRPPHPDSGAASRAVLLVGHGTDHPPGVEEILTLGGMVAGALPDRRVATGFLELAQPAATVMLDRLVADGAGEVTVLPLLLLAAGHAKSDVPAVVLEGRLDHPETVIRYGSPLGVAVELLPIAAERLAQVDGTGLPLVVIARGTSDPDANADAFKATRLLAEWTGAPWSLTGFTGVTTPSVAQVLEMAGRLTAGPVALFFWFLVHGRLIERARRYIDEFRRESGRPVLDAGYFGPDRRLVPLILRRVEQAETGTPLVNCDLCLFRHPYPGSEDRTGRPIGVGDSFHAHRHLHDGETEG